jgi:hypothetical protein
MKFFCVGGMYSGEYDVCDVTLSVYPPWPGIFFKLARCDEDQTFVSVVI